MYPKKVENPSMRTIVEAERSGKIITLPDSLDHIGWLENKLFKYQSLRAKSEKLAPDFIQFKCNDYKIAILERLLQQGRVDVDALAQDLKAQEGELYNASKFAEAAAIITKHLQPDNEHLYEESAMIFAH